nr:EAL domain-containing protein [uncultured Rhodoferax sp.]
MAIVLALSLSYSFIIRAARARRWPTELASGLLFGGIAMVAVANPVWLSTGLRVDGSTVVLSMATAVAGPLSGALAAVIALSPYLISDGLSGWGTALAIVLSTLTGVACHAWRRPVSGPQWAAVLGVCSLLSQAVVGLCTLAVGGGVRPGVGPDLLTMVLVYSPAGWLLGLILVDARQQLQSVDALHRQQARMRAIVGAMPDLLCLLDRDGVLLEVLSGLESECGKRAHGFVGHPVHAVFADTDAQKFVASVRATLETRSPLAVEVDWPDSQSPRRLAARMYPVDVPGQDGELVMLLFRDVSTRQAAADVAPASEDRFFNLLQNVGAVAVQGYTPDGTITYWNHASSALYGYSEAEVLGRNLVDVLVPHETRAEFREAQARMQATGEAPPAGEMMLMHCSGRGVPVLSGQAIVSGSGGRTEVFRFDIDLTERKRTEAELRVAATAFEAQEGMMVTDSQRRILRVNQAFTRISGYQDVEVIGQTPTMFSSGWHDNAFYSEMNATLASAGTWEGELWNRRKNGEIHPQWVHITAVADDTGAVSHYVATVTDITQRKAAEDQIRQLAFYDPLTDLPNRRLLIDRLHHAVAISARNGRCGALLFIDLDHFKNLNDTLGHDMGDLLLQQVAQRLLDTVREEDTVARLGGDEYVVMLEGLDESRDLAASQATAVGEKIVATLNRPYQLAGHEFHSTPSMGLTLFKGHEIEVDELLKQADLAMYQAKGSGRNGMRFYDPQMQAAVSHRAAMEADIRQGILFGQFVLFFQPQVDAKGHVVGAEALLRWPHPVRGMVSPAEFIPVAEETGQILTLGSWILEAACAQLLEWATHPETEALTLAVNVSARQFRQQDFAQHILDMLDYTGANPLRLKLELTESLLVENLEDVILKMSALRARGVGFSLDDFGTGYSSLSYLKRLPLDQLKIDQSFVRDVLTDPNDAAIVKTILALGHTLGMKVIAEGVETPEQRDFLFVNGCASYQGYLYGRPMPADAFLSALRSPAIVPGVV